MHERAGERELLLHAAGEPVGEAIAKRRELRQLEQPLAPLANGRIAQTQAMNLGKERDVFVDREIAVQAEALREIAKRLCDGGAPAPGLGQAPAPCRRPVSAARTSAGWSSSFQRRRARSGRTSRRARQTATGRARATTEPYFFRDAIELKGGHVCYFSSLSELLKGNLRFDRHPLLEDALAVVDGNLHPIDELRTVFGRLHVPGRELGFRRDIS